MTAVEPESAVTVAPTATRRSLPVVVFIAGASSLAIEICASRLLAPYFGNSTVVWANVIGLILIYLSVGYWLGGRLADRHPTPRALGVVLLLAAASIAVLPFIAQPFLNLAVRGLNALSVGVVIGSFFSTLLLFAVPVSLLGMVSPFALRLSLPDVSRAGRTSGRLSSLATIGAIAGTFGAALLLIPAIGTQRTMLTAALATALATLPLLIRPAVLLAAVVAGLLAIPPASPKPEAGTIAEREDAYQFVQVLREGDGKIV
ncbi:MAG: fused MFS/spermidine synthase, partial [Candidatus Dormibacteraeota bacterium]|nr:fused MFS/spermidine synthase [Candidatus Dormibacteraeota bacterium]